MKRLLALSLLLASASACSSEADQGPLRTVVEVKLARATLADLPLEVRAPATLHPRARADLASRITAHIVSLEASKGDRVAAGQLLARLERRDLEARMREARAQVKDARAALEKMRAGTLPGEVERAQGRVATAQAEFKEADKIYRRRQALYEQGAIPSRELLLSRTRFEQAKTALRVAQRTRDLLLEQSRRQDLRMAESRLEQARARLGYIQVQLSFTEIRSPFAGTLTEQFLYPGDMARPDRPLFTLMDLSRVVARGQVPEDQSGAIRKGNPCLFHPVDSPGKQFEGTITVVNQAVDPARRTLEVWCRIPNPRGELRGGVFGNLAIRTGTAARSVVVPVPAVQWREGSDEGVAFVVDEHRLAHRREVRTGVVSGNRVQILKGLEAGETVVVEGGYGLQEGTQVRPAGEGH